MNNETRYFVDAQGNFLGGWATPEDQHPKGATEVPSAPVNASDKWDGAKWVPAQA